MSIGTASPHAAVWWSERTACVQNEDFVQPDIHLMPLHRRKDPGAIACP